MAAAKIPLGDAILDYALWSDTTGVLDDIMGLARLAHPYCDWNYAVHRVADSIANYAFMWTDMDPIVPLPTPAEDARKPEDYVVRTKAFLRRWAARVHGRDPGLTQEQCWGRMQEEFACELGR